MRIVLVSCVFPPEHLSSARMGEETAEELIRRGHHVHVYAPFPSHPQGRLFEGYKRRLYSTSSRAGYTLTHCFATISSTSTMLGRFAENVSFGISSGLRILFSKRTDVIYSNSWPIVATGIVTIAAKVRRIPLIIRVQDAYPESLVTQGRVTDRHWIFRLLRFCDVLIARASAKLLMISPGFQELYLNDRGVAAEKLDVIPNWGNDEPFAHDPSEALAFRRGLNIPDDAFVAVYAGNVGVASNAEMLVSAFAQLKEYPKIYLVIAGEGSQLDACRSERARHGLNRVILHSPWKAEETGPVLQMADVLLLPTKGEQSLNSIPSKLITYLLFERPVIAAVLPESDTGRAIAESSAGWVIEPDCVDAMARALIAASTDSSGSLRAMGKAGREYALRFYTRSSNLPRIVDAVLNPTSRTGNPPTENAEASF